MPVIVVNDFGFVNGGASKIALGSAIGLAAAGEDVILFTAVGPVDPTLLEVPHLRVICLGQHDILSDPSRIRAMRQGLWNSRAQREFERLLTEMDPRETIVHIHMWAKALSAAIARTAAKRGCRVVLTLHDFQAMCPNGTLFNHGEQKLCQVKPLSARCLLTDCDSRSYAHKLWRFGRQLIQGSVGLIPRGVETFISLSDLAEDVSRQNLESGVAFSRVANFIDAEKEMPVAVENNADFVFVGRLAAEKGVLLWAECAQRAGIPGVFIGDGELTAEIRLRYPSTEVTGWLTAQQTRTRMRRARALIFPSLWYETQGLVVAEAAAMGIPCIVSDETAAREWVSDQETGLWFKGRDLEDLERKARLLRDSPELARRLGRAAHQRYWAKPSTLKEHVSGLQRIYRSSIAPHAGEKPLFQIEESWR